MLEWKWCMNCDNLTIMREKGVTTMDKHRTYDRKGLFVPSRNNMVFKLTLNGPLKPYQE